jgi:hypothetical protein
MQIMMPSSRISNEVLKTKLLRLLTFIHIMMSFKEFAPFVPNFPSIPYFPMLKATKTDNTHLPISLQQHKSIFWLIKMQAPSTKNKLIALVSSQHGF